MNKMRPARRDQDGFASIVIALVLVIVLALITTGFGQLVRREQKDALDRQLSTEAYDAAESGIDDAYSDIASGVITTTNGLANPNVCMTPLHYSTGTATLPPDAHSAYPVINGADGVLYSCLLVNLNPDNIEFTGLSNEQSQEITFSTNASVDHFEIDWGDTNGNTSSFAPSLGTGFLPYDQWSSKGYPAVLEVTIAPLSNLNRSTLINNSFTAFLYPTSSAASPTLDTPANDGITISGNCTTVTDPYPCHATIGGFSSTGPFAISVIDYYTTSNIVIAGHSFPGALVTTTDGQAQIDVTGKAQDVLKRLQVRVPIVPKPNIPPFALQGQNICKRIETAPTESGYDSAGGAGSPDPCSLGGILTTPDTSP